MKPIFSFLALFCFLSANTQNIDIQHILKQTDKLLDTFQSATYDVEYKVKSLIGDEISYGEASVIYIMAPDDTLNFFYEFIDSVRGKELYNGNYRIISYQDFTKAYVISLREFPSGSFQHPMHGYTYFNLHDRHSFSSYYESPNIDSVHAEVITFDDQEVYAITLYQATLGEAKDFTRIFYIRTEDFLPVGYYTYVEFDRMTQHYEHTYKNIVINPQLSDDFFNEESYLSVYDSIEFLKPREQIPLLEAGTLAPEFKKPAIHTDTMQLADLKGKIVLLDFWYRSCYPCILAMPELIRIQESFPEQVVFLGVNIADSEAQILRFFDTREFEFLTIYHAKDVANTYKVQSYPTLYIIDQEGAIKTTHSGFSENMYDTIREIILSMLDE